MILPLISSTFAGISMVLATINLFFIAQHGDQCGQYKRSPSVQTKTECKRYGLFVSFLGAFVLLFIGLSMLADIKTAKRIAFLLGGYKFLLPVIVWCISFITPGKKVWVFKKTNLLKTS